MHYQQESSDQPSLVTKMLLLYDSFVLNTESSCLLICAALIFLYSCKIRLKIIWVLFWQWQTRGFQMLPAVPPHTSPRLRRCVSWPCSGELVVSTILPTSYPFRAVSITAQHKLNHIITEHRTKVWKPVY